MEKKWTKWYAMTSHVNAYRSLELLFGTHTFHLIAFLRIFIADLRKYTAYLGRCSTVIKLNTGAKEIQQENPGGPDNSQSIRPENSSSHLYLFFPNYRIYILLLPLNIRESIFVVILIITQASL